MPLRRQPHGHGELNGRADFGHLFNARGLTQAGIEIGVDRGIFARELLTHWSGRELYCVDPWAPYDHMPWDRTGDLMLAAINLAPFGDRVRLCRMTGDAFSKQHKLGPILNWVYIDGDHEYDAVMADITLWWPQIPDHGILAGHDFDEEHTGVWRAVQEFAAQINRPIHQTQSGYEPPSWYFYKQEPSELVNVQDFSRRQA